VHARQLRIVLALLRLTYGWRRRSVRLSELELADFSGALLGASRRAGGSFRTDLAELVREGVITRLETGKRGILTWAINKNFTTWGKFSVSAPRLTARWNPRPNSTAEDESAVASDLARNRATQVARNQATPNEGDDSEWPGTGPDSGPVLGHNVARYQAPIRTQVGLNQDDRPSERQGNTEKDIKSKQQHRESTPPAAAAADVLALETVTAYAIGLATAANLAIAARWGEQTTPILPGGITQQLAADLITAGVPLELARHTIADKVRTGRFSSVPGSVRYFAAAIAEAFQADQQRRRDRDSVLPGRRGGAPAHISRALEIDRQEQEDRLQDAYLAARAKLVAAWRADPDHAAQLTELEGEAWAEFPDDNPFTKTARDIRILQLVAAAAGLPDFDAWKLTQKAS
jgi:hypothetical protein